MKITYTTPNGRLTFELEVDTGKSAFAAVAAIQELFEEPDCGACGSKNIRCSVRHIDDYTYYNLVCVDCTAQLNFGQHQSGKGLFVKRKDEDGNPVGSRGWYVWQGKEQRTNQSQRGARQTAPDDAYEAEPGEHPF